MPFTAGREGDASCDVPLADRFGCW